ncbi:MAG: hypothetical protein L0Z54_05970 [Thermoplasmata archaeon]|nr:hypothetical protein [Thermoplasmata archaeon]
MRDDRAQLIIAMGVLLAFTLLAVGSNAVYLNYIKKSMSYTSTGTNDLSGNPDVLRDGIEWDLNSERVRRGPWSTVTQDAVVATVDCIAETLLLNGIRYSLDMTNTTYERHQNGTDSMDTHRIHINTSVTVDDGVSRMTTPYVLHVVNALSDPWPSALGAFHYRLPVAVRCGAVARENFPVHVEVDFWGELQRLGATGAFDPDTIAVVQHYKDTRPEVHFNPLKKIVPHAYRGDIRSGEVIWVADGVMHPNTYRYYYIYFDVLGNGADLSPDGDLVVTTDGWVRNALLSLELWNGSHIELYRNYTTNSSESLGTGSPAWSFRENDVQTGERIGWSSWDIVYNSSVYAVVETTHGTLTRRWSFYGNCSTIGITDTWSNAGRRSMAHFRTQVLGYAGKASPVVRVRNVDSVNEPLAPEEPFAGALACAVHHDNGYVLFAYIYPLDMMIDDRSDPRDDGVEWSRHRIPLTDFYNESMTLFQDHTEDRSHDYWLHMAYDRTGIGSHGVGMALDKTRELADPPDLLVFHAHRSS